MGRSSILRCSTVSVVELRVVSTNSAEELTLMTSRVPATDNVTGRSTTWPTVTITFSTSSLANPGASTVTL
jgi:hypothetical protein